MPKKDTYRGSASGNSILGNFLRGQKAGVKTLLSLEKQKGKWGMDKQRAFVDKYKLDSDLGLKDIDLNVYKPKGTNINPMDNSDVNDHYIGTTYKVPKHVLAHEMGHHLKHKDNDQKSYNKRLVGFMERQGPKFRKHSEEGDKVNSIKSFKEYLRKIQGSAKDLEDRNNIQVRAEREAWIEGRKLLGGKSKETDQAKKDRRNALKSYTRTLSGTAQQARFLEDKKYRNKMLGRTAIKVGSTVGGGVLGNKISKKVLSKSIQERKDLENKKLNTKAGLTIKEERRLKYLKRKIKSIIGVSTVGGTYLGYKGGKEVAKRAIKIKQL